MSGRHLLEPLCRAIRARDMTQLKALLEQGAPAHDQYKPPIQAATEANTPDMIALLATHDADLNVFNYSGDTPLHTAIHYDHPETFDALIAAGADPYICGERYDKPSALMIAIKRNEMPWIQRVIDAGSDFSRHSVPVHAHAAQHAPELIDVLIKRGAGLDDVNIYGQTALTWLAHQCETKDAVQALLDAGADVTARNAFGWTPAMIASAFGPRVISSALGRAKAAPEVVMLDALGRDYLPDIQTAFAHVATDGCHYKGQGWLSSAISAETVEWLLAQGVDPLHRNPQGETALCHVQWQKHDCVQAVINATTYPESDLNLAMRKAVKDGHKDVVRSLIAAGANPANDSLRSPMLFDAARRGDVELVEMLCEAGADPNLFDATACSLFYRVFDHRKAVKLVECLLKAGAAPDLVNPQGDQPINELLASLVNPKKKHISCLKLLLNAGADGRTRGEFLTPFEEIVSNVLKEEEGWGNALKAWLKVETRARLKAAVAAEGGDKKKGFERLANETDAYLLGLWIHASQPTAKKLIKAGVGYTGQAIHSPLFATVDLDLEPMMTLLLCHGFDPNVRGPYDRSLLAHAASLGRHARMEQLMIAGADPGCDGRGDVLLSALNSPDAVATVSLLLSRGADPALKESTKTPLEHARYRLANYRNKTGLAEVIALLEAHT